MAQLNVLTVVKLWYEENNGKKFRPMEAEKYHKSKQVMLLFKTKNFFKRKISDIFIVKNNIESKTVC